MTDQFIGEIRAVGFNFPPTGWAVCDGQSLQIRVNTALFSLLGTNYGGDGVTTFALPNLQGASPMHSGQGNGLSNVFVGQEGGTEVVRLTTNEIPFHNHNIDVVDGPGAQNSPAGALYAQAHYGRAVDRQYAPPAAPAATMSPFALGVNGLGQPHNNLPPYLVVNFIIALEGIFPPRP